MALRFATTRRVIKSIKDAQHGQIIAVAKPSGVYCGEIVDNAKRLIQLACSRVRIQTHVEDQQPVGFSVVVGGGGGATHHHTLPLPPQQNLYRKLSKDENTAITKIGHGGTLDKMASGVLVVGIGKGTKELGRFQTKTSKEYVATGVLGIRTDTLDMDDNARITATKDVPDSITEAQIEAVLEQFRGDIHQIPPEFSALKVEGVRAYNEVHYASNRKMKPRPAYVEKLELLNFDGRYFTIKASVGSGTYIRTLVDDIGIALGNIATMVALQRNRQGEITLDQCVPLEYVGTEYINRLFDEIETK